MIPEIPIFGSTEFKIKCTLCKNPIAGWVIAENEIFCCPSCNQKLQSNYKTARKNAIITGITLYFIALVLFIFVPKESNIGLFIYVFGGIIPLLAGFLIFKILLNINGLNNKT